MKRILLSALGGLMIFPMMGQVSQGGLPPSFSEPDLTLEINEIILDKPDIASIASHKGLLKYQEAGILIDTEINVLKAGTWSELPSGGEICRLKIQCNDAEALGLYYQSFKISHQGKLFVYNIQKTFVLGAYTQENNHKGGAFASEPVPGNSFILEYFHPAGDKNSIITIDQIGYVFQFSSHAKGFGDAGPCEVNVNCPEGLAWKNQINGVARILLKQGSSLYWCTGSLINNTNQDRTPYFFTANHCGKNASLADYDQWIFYFNYQSESCEDPTDEPEYNSISGSSFVAKSVNNEVYGSDFKLLMLNEQVPASYNPYYNGWSRMDSPSPSGVGIHHPQGDIKKISTYTSELLSTRYEGSLYDPEGKYWRLTWAETETNHGVTEGGSSGSPLFDQSGLIVGQLTGGAASCSNLNGPDYYGKFSFSWESNGSYDSLQLKPWLDPDNTGITTLEGIGSGGSTLQARFQSATDTILIGQTIQFYDLSLGDPSQWTWTFEGGTPQKSTIENPEVQFNNFGSFDVKLVVRNNDISDSIVKKDIIHVLPAAYPNPASEYVTLYFGIENAGSIEVYMYNSQGKQVMSRGYQLETNKLNLDISHLQNDLYFLRVIKDKLSSVSRILVLNAGK